MPSVRASLRSNRCRADEFEGPAPMRQANSTRAAAVERYPHALFETRVQDIWIARVLAHGAHELIGGQSGGERAPRGAEIVRREDVRGSIARIVTVYDDERLRRAHARRVDRLDATVRTYSRGRHLRPVLSAVARHLDQPVVRAHPD